MHHRPNFLIFDEPTNHLDVETVEALGKAFAKFKVINPFPLPLYLWASI